jgi:hypothetical protein
MSGCPPTLETMCFCCQKFKANALCEKIWSLLRDITFWTLWIGQNNLVFNNERWSVDKVHKVIWDALLDYGRAAWNRCMRPIRKTPRVEKKLLEKFDKSWGRH